MGVQTEISWADSTLNWWEGCTKVGPGCDHCYAEARNARFGGGESVNWGPGAPRRLTSEHNRNSVKRWQKWPLGQCPACHWRGEYKQASHTALCAACGHKGLLESRRRVFCSSLADVFDNEAPQEWRDEFFAAMEASPNLDFLVLTKRVGNVRKMVPASWLESGGWPSHVWLGATIVNQEEAERDIPKLLKVPARVRFLSMEPLLGSVELDGHTTSLALGLSEGIDWLTGRTSQYSDIFGGNDMPWTSREDYEFPVDALEPRVHWVIVGGESGPGARPMNPQWVRDIRDQCAAAGVAFLHKQNGEFVHHSTLSAGEISKNVCVPVPGEARSDAAMVRIGKKAAGNLLDGVKHEAWPV